MIAPGHEFDLDAHLHKAQQRILGARPRLRTIAVAAWLSFLCGIAVLWAFILMIPEPFNHMINLGWLSGFFLVAWGSGFAAAIFTSSMVESIWSLTRKKN